MKMKSQGGDGEAAAREVGGGPKGETFKEVLRVRSFKQKEIVTTPIMGKNRNEGAWLSFFYMTPTSHIEEWKEAEQP
jgi:hypothetical protein